VGEELMIISQKPDPTMIMQPTIELVRQYSKQRIRNFEIEIMLKKSKNPLKAKGTPGD
jgi:hypothetical protein